jgi:transposase
VSEIARQTGRDRKTVRKMLQRPLVEERKPRQARVRKIDPYVEYLHQRMNEGVYNAHKLYLEIQGRGYGGGETQVREYVHRHRPARLSSQATVRFETEPGQQAQVDWGHFGYIETEGKRQRLYGFVMTLGWSRVTYLTFTTSLETGWFLRCHQYAFEYFGGIPREVLHDNLKSAVLDRDHDGNIYWNPRYLDFALAHGFAPRACQPYRAQTKGKVENGVHYVRVNFWPGLHFENLADLNRQALVWCNEIANVRLHGTTGEVPFQRFAQENLQALPTVRFDTGGVTMRRVSRDCLLSYNGNYYSVPALYAGQSVVVRELENGQLLMLNSLGDTIAQHALLNGKRRRSIQPAHYEALQPPPKPEVRPSGLPLLIVCAAPQVDVRPLSVYAALVEEASHE